MRNFRETIFPFRWNPSCAKGFQNRVKYRSFKDNFSVVKIGLEHHIYILSFVNIYHRVDIHKGSVY